MLKTFIATLALAGGVGLFTPSTAEAGDWSVDVRYESHGHRHVYHDRYDSYQPRTHYRESYRTRYSDFAPRYSHSYGYRYESYRPSYRSYYAPRYYSRGYYGGYCR